MAVTNQLAKSQQKEKFSVFMQKDAIKGLINNTLQNPKKAQSFTTAIISAVSTNPTLQECDSGTIISSALLGETLGLSPSPQLGHYYLVPYDDNKADRKVATFQLGYKGYIQLAIRSGQYKKINVVAIKKGELVKYDALNEELIVNLMDDELERESAETIGYYAMFELVNGFRKALYWSKQKMMSHADKYSKAFSLKATNGKVQKVSFADFEAGKVAQSDMWKYSSFWYKDFDGMAFKTMLRQLISKWGIMSIELQSAFVNDMSFTEGEKQIYVDNDVEEAIQSDVIDVPQSDSSNADLTPSDSII